MVFDIEGLSIECLTVFSGDIEKDSIVLIGDIHMLFIRANGKACSLIRQFWTFKDGEKPAKLVATTKIEKPK